VAGASRKLATERRRDPLAQGRAAASEAAQDRWTGTKEEIMKLGRMMRTWLFAVTTFAVTMLAVTMLACGAWAQDYSQPGGPNGEAAPAATEQPQTNVARVSLIHGDVSMNRGDTGDWEVTSINAPLVRGDQVATGEKSRTEIQLDYANIVRLAAGSQIKIADLTRTRIQLQVAQGYVNFTQFKGSEADVEIDTPNVAVRPLKHGRYRVQVNSDSETDVIVREGEAEITTPQGSTRVKEGEVIQIRGLDNPEYKIAGAPGKDEWDSWNKDRDNAVKNASSWGRTNRYYTGVNDLDAYGHWVWVPGYGNVWQPYSVNAGWAPYQAGRWVWEPGWGWTWVSYEPWGWAPYHYGRWFFYGGNWCWWPGPVYVSYRPVWSPAFVFFVGFGHHSSFGFGSIGWFPVGPHDPFFPWWGRGFNRVNVVNITNITVINERRGNFIAPLAVRGRQPFFSNVSLVQTNARVRGSITSVGAEDFGHGNFSNRRFGVGESEWRDARVMTANVPVVPSRENLRVNANSGAQAGAAVPGRNAERFYTKHQPPAGPENFHTQVERVQRAVGPDAVNANRGNMQVERRDQGGATAGGNAGTTVRNGGELPHSGGAVSSGANGGAIVSGHRDGRSGAHESGNAAASGAASSNEGGKESSPGNFRRFGESGKNNGGVGPGSSTNSGPVTKENAGRLGANEGVAQNNTPSNNHGNAGNTGQASDRAGWARFGHGDAANNGRSEQNAPAVKSNDQGHAPRTDNASPSQTPRSEDHGWQRFPSNSGSGRDSSTGRTESGGSKPPLELHRPIVTPRDDSRSTQRETPRYTPPPSRTPESHTEQPRYTPPPSRGSDSGRGGYTPRNESPRYSPPSRSESHGGGSSSRGGSSSHGSSSSSHSSGSHSESKSSGSKR
jgi:uncharacterized protein DUF6600/FecR-like protein